VLPRRLTLGLLALILPPGWQAALKLLEALSTLYLEAYAIFLELEHHPIPTL